MLQTASMLESVPFKIELDYKWLLFRLVGRAWPKENREKENGRFRAAIFPLY